MDIYNSIMTGLAEAVEFMQTGCCSGETVHVETLASPAGKADPTEQAKDIVNRE